MIKRRKNPDNEVRIELLRELYKKDLEKVLWMLYNPTGFCEECGHSWDDLSCSCRNCQYDELDNSDQVINEPCGNTCVCVCDYFDGEPSDKQIEKFIKRLAQEELTYVEIDYYHNFDKFNKNIINSICHLIDAMYYATYNELLKWANTDFNKHIRFIFNFINNYYIDTYSFNIKHRLENIETILQKSGSNKIDLTILNRIGFNIVDHYIPDISKFMDELAILHMDSSTIVDVLEKPHIQYLIQQLAKYPYVRENYSDKLKSLQEAIESSP